MDTAALEKLARLIRYYILIMTSTAGSGHATSSLSAVELMTLLFFKYLRFDFNDPKNVANDHVIFSKGHASPLFFALYGAAGQISEKELLTYRQFGSNLEGHPTARFPYTEAATGSLGQGLSIGAGEALALKKKHLANKIWVLLGDGELAEGSVWEATAFASFHKLNNLVAIIDVNRLGQSQQTAYEWRTEVYQRRLDAFGWSTLVINGHDWSEINAAYEKALIHPDGPVAIIAKTIKGKGVSFLENKNGWHGKALSANDLTKALAELREVDKTVIGKVLAPENAIYTENEAGAAVAPSTYAKPVATREAFGNALVRLGNEYPNMVVLDGDVQNSTYTELFAKTYHDRFIQCFIAEQNMVGVGFGLERRGYAPWITTFGVFFSRAFDQIRMAALTGSDLNFCGSHAGVSIGADGPSQMGLQDVALFRSIPGSTVLSPCDPYETEYLTVEMMQRPGISYLRTMREATPVIYSPNDKFPIGGSKTFHGKNLPAGGAGETVTVVATGVTVHEALKAQKEMPNIRVIDAYSIKPIDVEALKKAARETKAIITVEDHVPEGGLGEAVMSVLSESSSRRIPIIQLAVKKIPRSGKPEQLLAYEEIDARAIITAAKLFS